MREITREKDKALQWRLISCVLAYGLKNIGYLVVGENKKSIFVKDIEEIINMINRDKVDSLYKFFCENEELE